MKLHLLPALACTALLSSTIHAAEPIPYPSTNCIVSDEKLGEMGKPVMIDYQRQQIGFCCQSCVKKFLKDPDTYLAKLPAPPKQ